jgi:hypothetical protein
LSHSWQDFFGHAIHSINGFVDPAVGSPDNPGDSWPSSYHNMSLFSQNGEHRNLVEPSSADSQRYQQAIDYVERRFTAALPAWLMGCKCECEKGEN